MPRTTLYANDLMTGLLAGLALRGARSFSVRDRAFDRAFHAAYAALEERAVELGLDLRFRVFLDPMHGDSETAAEALYHAMASRLVTTEMPPSGRAWLHMAREEAPAYLAHLAGSADLYAELAQVFVDDQSKP